MSIRKFYGSKEDSEQATRTLCEAFKDDPLMEATFGKEIWKEDAAMIFSWALWIYKCEDMIDLIVENEGSKNSYVVAAAIWEGNSMTFSLVFRFLIHVVFLIYHYGLFFTYHLLKIFVALMMKKEKIAPKAYHLNMIGTASRMQGKGIGSKLLKYGVSRASNLGVKCYLESSNPRNVPFYLRNGFEIVEEYYPFVDDKRVDGKGPVVTLMMK